MLRLYWDNGKYNGNIGVIGSSGLHSSTGMQQGSVSRRRQAMEEHEAARASRDAHNCTQRSSVRRCFCPATGCRAGVVAGSRGAGTTPGRGPHGGVRHKSLRGLQPHAKRVGD